MGETALLSRSGMFDASGTDAEAGASGYISGEQPE
jgi:hypothetical protein